MRKNAMIIGCLVLSAAVLAVWIRTHYVGEEWRWIDWPRDGSLTRYQSHALIVAMGGIEFFFDNSDPTDDVDSLKRAVPPNLRDVAYLHSTTRSPRYPVTIVNDDAILGAMGFSFGSLELNIREIPVHRWEITVPLWAFFVLIMALPGGSYFRDTLMRHREEVSLLSQCPRCGESLNRNSKRCGLCDRPIAVHFEV